MGEKVGSMTEKRGSAGGKACAIIQKEQAKRRIDEYNLSPNICLNCGKQILANYNQHLSDIKKKKFCTRKCSYNYNKENLQRKYDNHIDKQSFIHKISDYEIINIFNESNSIKEFGEKLGYKNLQYRNKSVCNKLKTLGLCIDDLRLKETTNIANRTKGYIFEKYSNWQTARSQIQKLQELHMKSLTNLNNV